MCSHIFSRKIKENIFFKKKLFGNIFWCVCCCGIPVEYVLLLPLVRLLEVKVLKTKHCHFSSTIVFKKLLQAGVCTCTTGFLLIVTTTSGSCATCTAAGPESEDSGDSGWSPPPASLLLLPGVPWWEEDRSKRPVSVGMD